MTKGVTKKTQRDDRLRKKRAKAPSAGLTGAKKPLKAIPPSRGYGQAGFCGPR
jgi:hypothetical protein